MNLSVEAVQELKAMENRAGKLTPEQVVEAAKKWDADCLRYESYDLAHDTGPCLERAVELLGMAERVEAEARARLEALR
jgi:hypothetical protein